MTCCKNIKLSFKTHFAFKKAYKFLWKNAHSTVLQNAWSHIANKLIEKSKLITKNNYFLWITNLQDKENLVRHWTSIRALQKTKEPFENAMKCCKNIKLSLKTNSAFKKAFKF